ncbi:hypothetical protein [Streptomyces griseus]|uniref:hypothetical protein n=1 Tax=Streptomyces griseus TaxID=1911 RepID=UPI003799798F
MVMRGQPGSALAGDDAKTDPYQISHSACTALSVAVDHLHCFRSTFAGDPQGNSVSITLHTHGQYSLLRGAFENSARAVWMLGPTLRRYASSGDCAHRSASTRSPTA